jgi:hypothetical protein
MAATENVTVQTKQDVEEMLNIFLNMTELERARVFGYAQGIESMIEEIPDKRSA